VYIYSHTCILQVLAAANPIYGHYDDTKSVGDNIDLMTTILSRFDCIFIVRDVRDVERDKNIARHVLNIHMTAASDTVAQGEINVSLCINMYAYLYVHLSMYISFYNSHNPCPLCIQTPVTITLLTPQ
jgi:DNA replicative helicase MCM subunit Mcm2 (Cdc46/Mcm family)